MKKLLIIALVSSVAFTGCSKKDISADATVAAPALSAAFSINDQPAAKEGTAVQFSNTSAGAVAYSWDFGNGRSSAEKSPSYTYPACGTYSVKLTVTDAKGATQVLSSDLIVNCIFRAPGAPPVTHATVILIFPLYKHQKPSRHVMAFVLYGSDFLLPKKHISAAT